MWTQLKRAQLFDTWWKKNQTWVGSANRAKYSHVKFHMVSTTLWCVHWAGMLIAVLKRSASDNTFLPFACKQTKQGMLSSHYSYGSQSRSLGATLLMAVYPTRKLIAFTRCKMIPWLDSWNENQQCWRSQCPGLRVSATMSVIDTLYDNTSCG